MDEFDSEALSLLQEIQSDFRTFHKKLTRRLAELEAKLDRAHSELVTHIDSIHQFTLGESILGGYATAKFERRIAVIEERLTALEERR